MSSRRGGTQRSPRRPHPQQQAVTVRERLTSRPVLGMVLALLVGGCGILAGLIATGSFGDSTQYLTLTTCRVNTTNCEIRGPANIHADFALFIKGQEVNFDQPRYTSAPANAEAAIRPPYFTVVSVTKALTTWDAFFRSIGIDLLDPTFPGVTAQTTCLTMPGGAKYCSNSKDTFKFFVNGVEVDGVSNTDINDLDQVLISYGPETAEQVRTTQLPKVTHDACKASDRCVGTTGQ